MPSEVVTTLDSRRFSEASILIEEVRKSFLSTLPGLLDALTAAVHNATGADPATCVSAHELAHRLAGSGGTFGLTELSNEARRLATLLEIPRAGVDWASDVDFTLRRVLDSARMPTELISNITPSELPDPPPAYIRISDPILSSRYPHPYGRWASLPVVLLIERGDTRNQIQSLLQQFGFLVVATSKVTKFPLTPLAFLCTLEKAAEVRGFYPKADIIAVVDNAGLEERLAAVRLGCRGTIAADVDAPELSAVMERLVPLELEVPRLLIVDDDAYTSQRTAIILEQAGLEVHIMTDPSRLLEQVAELRPHLVIMDMRLPGCTGLELAAVLRQDDRMVGVPIVFLTAEDRPARALAALEVGADDFLIKPVESNRLVSVVLSRLERSRVLRSFMDHDSLTRLLSHARTLERLEAEVLSAQRRGDRLCIAILDLDHFKRVNDTYGHATGDRVLRSLSTVLRRRARRTDIIGRCGGEEFVVILPGAAAADACNVIDERREMFGALHYATPTGQVVCTFSAGVAELRGADTPATLWERADHALYDAKHLGRNRVVAAGRDEEEATP